MVEEGRADVVIGSRFMKGADTSGYRFSFFRVMGNRVVNAWVSLLCGQSITDVTTGYKAWTKAAMQTIRFRLDRSGAELASEAQMPCKPSATHFVCDRPFLIVVKKRGAEHPFFVMWVDNAELLCKP